MGHGGWCPTQSEGVGEKNWWEKNKINIITLGKKKQKTLGQQFSKCGSQTCGISILWKRVKNADCWAPSQIHRVSSPCSTKPLGESEALSVGAPLVVQVFGRQQNLDLSALWVLFRARLRKGTIQRSGLKNTPCVLSPGQPECLLYHASACRAALRPDTLRASAAHTPGKALGCN